MKQFLASLTALFLTFNAHGASANYGIASVGFGDVEFSDVENSGLAYNFAFGRQIHRQWYAEVGYFNLTNDSEGDTELSGDALYIALLGKANNEYGELYYKLGIANADIASTRYCGNSELSGEACSFDEGVVAGIAGLGFDYYVGLQSMVRLEYLYLGGEDDLSTHLVSLGFRYNF